MCSTNSITVTIVKYSSATCCSTNLTLLNSFPPGKVVFTNDPNSPPHLPLHPPHRPPSPHCPVPLTHHTHCPAKFPVVPPCQQAFPLSLDHDDCFFCLLEVSKLNIATICSLDDYCLMASDTCLTFRSFVLLPCYVASYY